MPLFSWLTAQIYDKVMQDAETKCLRDWRSTLLNNASGEILEIGCGTGLNLTHYPNAVKHLILSEPNIHMQKKLQDQIALKKYHPIKIMNCCAESIPLPNASCDSVVSTLVLCSVKNQNKALKEIHRILKPKGKFFFIEHVAANNNRRRLMWQHLLEPFWKIIASGCHLTRPTEQAIINAGFTFKEITRQSMRGVPPIVRPCIKGIAIKN